MGNKKLNQPPEVGGLVCELRGTPCTPLVAPGGNTVPTLTLIVCDSSIPMLPWISCTFRGCIAALWMSWTVRLRLVMESFARSLRSHFSIFDAINP